LGDAFNRPYFPLAHLLEKPMPLSISFTKDTLPTKGSVILTATQGGKLSDLGKQLDKKTGGAISRAMKIKKFSGKAGAMFALLASQNHARPDRGDWPR
jgi:hypothetical protein